MEYPITSESKKNSKLVYVGVVFLVLFSLLSFLLHFNLFSRFDFVLMISLQKYISPLVDRIFALLSFTGSSEVTGIVLLILSLIIWKKSRKIPFALILFLLIFIVEILGKFVIEHPKPPEYLQKRVFEFYFPSSSIIKTKYSYPSGHMGRSVFVATLIAGTYVAYKKKRLNRKFIFFGVFFYIFIMSISRIYLGSHWLSDVLGGIFIGLGLSFISLAFLSYGKKA